ncbi:ROK family protein [Yersinia pekkanenii]|uniref:ROK-family transcriptional regulator n=1 Tax=Yersinia pekkanenii TaxID=1288385 RepID=A0A0T9PQM5_9GAMM|nr:ROK family protein [Yersinia pekkanenii]CNH77147.1 putative ROK-family transcriptional regulator [Yersinia pekkanenii]CRY68589.1 putative ROK-family transcriptional regulator [Yersinia pekkanenii]
MTTVPINTTRQMKQKNIMLVANTLKSLISATKSDISVQTGLSLATCGTILNELCAKGEIIAKSVDESRGGRPAKRYIYNSSYFSVLSIYAEGTNTSGIISSCLTSADGKILAEYDEVYNHLTAETLMHRIQKIVDNHNNIKAIGVGLPGVIVDGKVLTCDITNLEGLALTEQLSSRLGIFVQVGNDMNYTAFGFYRNNCRNINAPIAYIFMPPRHCAGCGIVISGEMLRGASQFAGEVSKLPFYDHPKNNMACHSARILERLIHIVSSLIVIINPDTIAISISDEQVSHNCIEDLSNALLKKFDSKHLPHFVYRDSIKPDYHNGISEYTLDAYNNFRVFEI